MGFMHKSSNVIFVIVVASRELAESLGVEASSCFSPKKPQEANHNIFIYEPKLFKLRFKIHSYNEKIVKPLLIIAAVVVISTTCICNSCIVNAEEITSGATSLKPHDPIHIYHNSGFTSKNGVTSGSGTQSDPYIIENWDINANGADGIHIEDTDAYFIVRNCEIYNGARGILSYNVTNGKIENITACYNRVGILLNNSSKNTITNCTICNNSAWGVLLSATTLLTNNTVIDCAIYNNSHNGISVCSNQNSNIVNCAVYNNSMGITLSASPSNKLINCLVYNNSENGISLWKSSNSQIINCSVHNNSNQGISTYSCPDIKITNCNIYNNYEGVTLIYSDRNTITGLCYS